MATTVSTPGTILPTEFSSVVVVTEEDAYTNGTDSWLGETIDIKQNDSVRIGFALQEEVVYTLYAIVFVLTVVGNILVIVTLVQDRRMRTVTNMFLLSLSTSDLIFGIFCMPFTVVGNVLGRFVFGEVICKMLPYIQGTSVTVSVWTMVVISLERYHAICHPLSSRIWQTKAHAYKAIAGVWLVAVLLNLPALIFTTLKSINSETAYKCYEHWPEGPYVQIYRLCLFVILMVVPLFLMAISYGLIIVELQKGMKLEKSTADNEKGENGIRMKNLDEASCSLNERVTKKATTSTAVRSTSTSDAKKRVVKMLIIIVALFFICWTPSWVTNIWITVNLESAKKHFGRPEVTIFKLMTYTSACVNPVVYCFMNKRFRQGFLNAFACVRIRASERATASENVSRFQSGRRANLTRPSPTNYTNVSSDSSV
ncbi:cholecystokinin receptor type A-like [Acanthaster planci]|uniref:Gastrin/cholecystokinin type B receptor n=1 Tax=Acanthaster planci TaxID=133434 RepID=A0A8B7XHM4_ACAPL|nr:cholecystokinin receptor type A-like [Acanthaster planci]XP_022079612.1 cholecystokinin receptor type A-like [Acanthaster planci]XP_022079613.1 cholecystokinin receptor type A-like [Acanthaster planci]